MSLPPLGQIGSLSRPLSLSEYYHASVGTSRFSLEAPREIVFVLRGVCTLAPGQWQAALDRAAAVNPGARLRLLGRQRGARWRSDGAGPLLRLVTDCTWNTQSDAGAGFIAATRLSLRQGPTVELIVAPQPDGQALVLLRTLHAVMDGRGALHFLADVFRALRGEQLLGTNAAYSDFEFKRSFGSIKYPQRQAPTTWPTGAPEGAETGDVFQRIDLGSPKKDLLARIVLAMAEFAYMRSDMPVRIALPVDLRARVPGLLTTCNFSDMMSVQIDRDDDVAIFRQKLQAKIDRQREDGYPHLSDVFKALPLPWLDMIASRTRWNYRTKKPVETAVISNLGRLEKAQFSCPGFVLSDMMVLPLPGSVFATLIGLDDRVEMMLGMPKVLADGGRFDAFVAYLTAAF